MLLSTSPGGRAAVGALEALQKLMGYFDGDVKATYSLPGFHQNFNIETGEIENEEEQKKMQTAVNLFRAKTIQ